MEAELLRGGGGRGNMGVGWGRMGQGTWGEDKNPALEKSMWPRPPNACMYTRKKEMEERPGAAPAALLRSPSEGRHGRGERAGAAASSLVVARSWPRYWQLHTAVTVARQPLVRLQSAPAAEGATRQQLKAAATAAAAAAAAVAAACQPLVAALPAGPAGAQEAAAAQRPPAAAAAAAAAAAVPLRPEYCA